MTFTQADVDAIVKRAKELGASDGLTEKQGHLQLATYGGNGPEALAMTIINGWHGKYDLIYATQALIERLNALLSAEGLAEWVRRGLTAYVGKRNATPATVHEMRHTLLQTVKASAPLVTEEEFDAHIVITADAQQRDRVTIRPAQIGSDGDMSKLPAWVGWFFDGIHTPKS